MLAPVRTGRRESWWKSKGSKLDRVANTSIDESNYPRARVSNKSETPQVFISYAHADVSRVRNLRDRLRQAGLKTWIDEDILSGKDWLDEIKSAIRQSAFCLLCLSPNSINRRGVIQKGNPYRIGGPGRTAPA